MLTNNKTQKIVFTFFLLMVSSIQNLVFGAEITNSASNVSNASDGETMVRYILAGVITLLVIIIAVLASAIKLAGKSYQQKIVKQKSDGAKIVSLILLLSASSTTLFAQTAEPQKAAFSFTNFDLYLIITILILLFIVILVLVKTLFLLMGIRREEVMAAEGGTSKVKSFFQKFNETVPIENEADLDMSHDYDGIRELDNKVPSWWSWAFISSILFAVIYLYRMFGSETLPNQYQELAAANEIAAEEKLAYLKKGANNVDENNVVMLSAPEIAEGATLFSKNCVPCHGDKGQGNTVGPNLTDDYWIHKGGIKDIFYTIKYGWAEKGMKSWKEDFSPGQIAQLASFVKSLHGTNPPNAKDKQGELYVENQANNNDSTTVKLDSNAVKK